MNSNEFQTESSHAEPNRYSQADAIKRFIERVCWGQVEA